MAAGVISTAVGAGLGIASSIFGGVKASQAVRNVKRSLESQRRQNRDWYDRRYNEDATERADAQAAFSKLQEAVRSQNRQSAGAQAVMGGTDESVAAAKAANASALSDTLTGIAVNGEARKDAVENQYRQQDAMLQSQLNEMELRRADEIKAAAQGVADVGGKIADSKAF